ncbi:hypothetical protein DSO57_1025553 [Entomophthora muscae]|uniref:Uncharacterized protein n=1 Tax=Entomophthora muscae TaxID=34485 RepID=A0ACC2RHA3_9FUNG|nr:hypothetical protein DSO57_1025553 [Entomophthora muscae]
MVLLVWSQLATVKEFHLHPTKYTASAVFAPIAVHWAASSGDIFSLKNSLAEGGAQDCCLPACGQFGGDSCVEPFGCLIGVEDLLEDLGVSGRYAIVHPLNHQFRSEPCLDPVGCFGDGGSLLPIAPLFEEDWAVPQVAVDVGHNAQLLPLICVDDGEALVEPIFHVSRVPPLCSPLICCFRRPCGEWAPLCFYVGVPPHNSHSAGQFLENIGSMTNPLLPGHQTLCQSSLSAAIGMLLSSPARVSGMYAWKNSTASNTVNPPALQSLTSARGIQVSRAYLISTAGHLGSVPFLCQLVLFDSTLAEELGPLQGHLFPQPLHG